MRDNNLLKNAASVCIFHLRSVPISLRTFVKIISSPLSIFSFSLFCVYAYSCFVTPVEPVGSRIRRRFYPPVNFIRHLHRLQRSGPGRPVSDTEFSVDSYPPISSSSVSIGALRAMSASGAELINSSALPSCNLTVEAAMAGKTNCNASTDVAGAADLFSRLPEPNRMRYGKFYLGSRWLIAKVVYIQVILICMLSMYVGRSGECNDDMCFSHVF